MLQEGAAALPALLLVVLLQDLLWAACGADGTECSMQEWRSTPAPRTVARLPLPPGGQANRQQPGSAAASSQPGLAGPTLRSATCSHRVGWIRRRMSMARSAAWHALVSTRACQHFGSQPAHSPAHHPCSLRHPTKSSPRTHRIGPCILAAPVCSLRQRCIVRGARAQQALHGRAACKAAAHLGALEPGHQGSRRVHKAPGRRGRGREGAGGIEPARVLQRTVCVAVAGRHRAAKNCK